MPIGISVDDGRAPRGVRRAPAAAALVLALAAGAANPLHSQTPSGDGTRAAASTGWTGADSVARPVGRSWTVMGAVLQISVWDADTARAVAAMTAARDAVTRVDGWMSLAQPASEVSMANRRAGSGSATTLSPWTAEVLDSALSLAAATGGALQAAAGPMRFDRATRRVWLPRRGMRLDLGTFVRGFALDRAIDALRAANVHGAVVDLGGTFAMLGTAPVGPRWSVALKNPFDVGEVYAAVQMDAGAVGTTTTGQPILVSGGVQLSEVLDPRTSRPVRGLASVSVLAPSAMLADALSTAFFVMGPAEGCRLAARYRGVDAVWVRALGAEAHEERDADDGVDPELVVITDGLADRLELLSEEPTDERATRCSALLASSAAGR